MADVPVGNEPLINPYGGEWAIMRPKLAARVGELRDQLEAGTGVDERIRGEIAGLRWIQENIEPTSPLIASSNYFPAGQSAT